MLTAPSARTDISITLRSQKPAPPVLVSRLGPPPAFFRTVPVEAPYWHLSYACREPLPFVAFAPASIRARNAQVRVRPGPDSDSFCIYRRASRTTASSRFLSLASCCLFLIVYSPAHKFNLEISYIRCARRGVIKPYCNNACPIGRQCCQIRLNVGKSGDVMT